MIFTHKSYFIHKKAIKNYLLHMKTQISQKMDMQYLCNKSPRYKLKIFIYIVQHNTIDCTFLEKG